MLVGDEHFLGLLGKIVKRGRKEVWEQALQVGTPAEILPPAVPGGLRQRGEVGGVPGASAEGEAPVLVSGLALPEVVHMLLQKIEERLQYLLSLSVPVGSAYLNMSCFITLCQNPSKIKVRKG